MSYPLGYTVKLTAQKTEIPCRAPDGTTTRGHEPITGHMAPATAGSRIGEVLQEGSRTSRQADKHDQTS
jgi:hypothetical protein